MGNRRASGDFRRTLLCEVRWNHALALVKLTAVKAIVSQLGLLSPLVVRQRSVIAKARESRRVALDSPFDLMH